MEEQELLRRAEDLARRASRKGQITNTGFLTPAERAQLETHLHPEFGLGMRFFGGYEDSERTVVFFVPEELLPEDGGLPEMAKTQICAVHYHAYFGEPGHRDYLGALMASGIARDRLGDILIQGPETTVFCLPGIRQHLLMVDRIGRVSVKAEDLPPEKLQIPPRERKTKSVSVMSMRVDAIAAGMFNLSRSACVRLIAEGDLRLNYDGCMKTDTAVREGDVLSLRGYGKGRVVALGGTSRKGRQFVELEIWQ